MGNFNGIFWKKLTIFEEFGSWKSGQISQSDLVSSLRDALRAVISVCYYCKPSDCTGTSRFIILEILIIWVCFAPFILQLLNLSKALPNSSYTSGILQMNINIFAGLIFICAFLK